MANDWRSVGISSESFYKSWKIVEFTNVSNYRNLPKPQVEGAIFTLQENGEIIWNLEICSNGPEFDPNFPLFLTDSYEVIYPLVGAAIQMCTVHGHIFEFTLDQTNPAEKMVLTFEGWARLSCLVVGGSNPPIPGGFLEAALVNSPSDSPYSLLPALDEGFFSDLELRDFKVHGLIFELIGINIVELEGLPAEVLPIVLHYAYAQCLPRNLERKDLELCIQNPPKSLGRDFLKACKDYVFRMELKGKIAKLTYDLHALFKSIKSDFTHGSISNTFRFPTLLRTTLQSTTVSFLRLVELCVLYGQESPGLGLRERLEILTFAKAQLPLGIQYLEYILRRLKDDYVGVTADDRADLADLLVDDILSFLEQGTGVMDAWREACLSVWTDWSAEVHSADPPNTMANVFREICRRREVCNLCSYHEQITAVHLYLQHKKEGFGDLNEMVQIRVVARNIDQLMEEVPVFLLRLQEIMVAFIDRFSWKDFKFCFESGITHVYRVVQLMKREKNKLAIFFQLLISFVQREELVQSLVNLGLIPGIEPLAPAQASTANPPEPDPDVSLALDDMNLHEQLTTPKVSRQNALAINAAKYFGSAEWSDMTFEIHSVREDGEEEILEFPGHRVLLAARSEYFRRALMSGMKESIHRRIVIHDTGPAIFKTFLRFIYVGNLMDVESLDFEGLADLIGLGDRYEVDSLRVAAEFELGTRHLDENSVIYLLTMADRYSARALRASCMDYIADNPGLMGCELFGELSPELQMEVYDHSMWRRGRGPKFFVANPSYSSSGEDGWENSKARLVCDEDEDEEHEESTHYAYNKEEARRNPIPDPPDPDPLPSAESEEPRICWWKLQQDARKELFASNPTYSSSGGEEDILPNALGSGNSDGGTKGNEQ